MTKFETLSRIPQKEFYNDQDLIGTDPIEHIGFPGEFPFTRGIHPTMYRGRLWTMRQYAGFGTAEESNRRYRYLLDHGQTGLSVAFDLPTQMGYDSDHPMSRGEVGRVGVAIDSLEDMEVLMKEIPQDQVSTSMTINATASILLCYYIAAAEKKGISSRKLRGTVQNDILKEYIARGTYIYPPEGSMRLMTNLFAFCKEHVPLWNTISVSGYHMREAGCTAVQEVAFTLADAIAYVEAALEAGLAIDDFAPRIAFFFCVHNDFFEEVAKFRAARRLWARMMKERFKPQNPRSCMLRFHAQTAGVSLTAQQPKNNIVRVTLQALAAVLGGTQSLHTNSYDEALSLPTEESVRIALRTQQIIAEESGIAHTVDPVAGSYYVENLTNEIEERARSYIEKIDSMGGMVCAIERGYPQKEIQDSAYRYQQEVEKKERIVVGVNQYREAEERKEQILRLDPALERQQSERVQKVRENRDQKRVDTALEKLGEAAQGDKNLLPFILEAARSYATLGEISDTLRKVFGTYREKIVV